MSDVEAAAFTKPGQKITIQYGATPATVEKVGNTPEKPKQTWARSAAIVIGVAGMKELRAICRVNIPTAHSRLHPLRGAP